MTSIKIPNLQNLNFNNMSIIVLCVCAACADLWAMLWKIRKRDYDMAIFMFCLFIIMIYCIILKISRL